MAQPSDPVLAQLKKLREGRGLSPDRLAGTPAVLSSLGTSDPVEAYQALQQLLLDLPESQQMRALIVDYGFNLEEMLGHPPGSREVDYLGDRRSSYAEVVGRDVKTVTRWSDRTLRELRAKLLDDYFDGHVLITAGVQRRRLAGIEVMRYEAGDDQFAHGITTSYQNPESGTSLPLVLYGFPREWRPTAIRFIVLFTDELPANVWALVADTVLDVGFGHERTTIELDGNMARCLIQNPRRDQLYGVGWEW